MLSAVYAVVVCLSVCVCVSVTLRYCIKTAKRRITQIMPHVRSVTLVYTNKRVSRSLCHSRASILAALTDNFEFDDEGGFAGVVLQQDAVSPGVRSLDSVERQRGGVVDGLSGDPRGVRHLLLSVPLPGDGGLRCSSERHVDDGRLAGVQGQSRRVGLTQLAEQRGRCSQTHTTNMQQITK